MLKTWARLFAHVRMNEEAVRNFSSESQDGGYRYKSEFEIIKERCKVRFLFFFFFFYIIRTEAQVRVRLFVSVENKKGILLYKRFLDGMRHDQYRRHYGIAHLSKYFCVSRIVGV